MISAGEVFVITLSKGEDIALNGTSGNVLSIYDHADVKLIPAAKDILGKVQIMGLDVTTGLATAYNEQLGGLPVGNYQNGINISGGSHNYFPLGVQVFNTAGTHGLTFGPQTQYLANVTVFIATGAAGSATIQTSDSTPGDLMILNTANASVTASVLDYTFPLAYTSPLNLVQVGTATIHVWVSYFF